MSALAERLWGRRNERPTALVSDDLVGLLRYVAVYGHAHSGISTVDLLFAAADELEQLSKAVPA